MTSKLATLRQASLELRTRIFRSLPWGQRVARLISVLASSTTEAFDKALVKALEKQGLLEAAGGYATIRGMGDRFFNSLSRKYYRDSEAVENAMVDVVVDVSNGKVRWDPDRGVQLSSFLFRVIQNRVISEMRSLQTGREHEQSLFDTDEDEKPIELDVEDPRALQHFESLLDASDMRDLKRKLNSVVDWGGGYLEMLLDGYNLKEIIGDKDRGVPSLLAKKMRQEWLTNPKGQPMTMGMWSKPGGWQDKLNRVIADYLRESL